MIGLSKWETFKKVRYQLEQNCDLICVHQSSYLKSVEPLNAEFLSSRNRSDSLNNPEKLLKGVCWTNELDRYSDSS